MAHKSDAGKHDRANYMTNKFYATTPIFYVNDAPHVGHAYNALSTDAVARWHRLIGDDVMFLTGTDEHGLKVQRSAEANDRTPQEQADVNSARFREAWELLNLSNDEFIRTTEPRHHTATQTLLQKAYDNGYVYKDTYDGDYCVSCEEYYSEDELIKAEDGSDDQWCRIHKRAVEHMVEENYFFKLSAFEDRLMEWHDSTPDSVTPDGFKNEAVGLIKQGLRDVSMTRSSIDWGVSVPWDSDHVFYVWYDALINYATAAGYGADEERFDAWWPAAHHFIGKDIIRFHTVYWPAMLLAAGIEDLPKFHVHGFLLLGGEKMAKSGNVMAITPAEMVEQFGVDGFRYAVLRDNPFGPDSDFSSEALLIRYNTDLANNYGNLLQRVITVATKKCGGIGPAPRPDSPLAAVVAEAYAKTAEAWGKVQASIALDATSRIVRETNEYLQATEPWKLEPGPEVDAVMGDALEALRIATILMTPAIPEAAEKAWNRIGLEGSPADQRLPDAAIWGQYPGGLALVSDDPLFPRIKG